MKQKRLLILNYFLLFLFVLLSSAQGQIFFEDNFNTSVNWTNAGNQNSFDSTLTNGVYYINANKAKHAILKHNCNLANGTYGVKLLHTIHSTTGSGIMICMQSDIQGYSFSVLTGQQYTFGKWVLSNGSYVYQELKGGLNSFIREDENMLKVVKDGSSYTCLVNGVVVETVTDPTFSSGAVGLFVGSGEKTGFDYAYCSSTIEPAKPLCYFSDHFDDNKLTGWKKLCGHGTIQEQNSLLTISADSLTLLYTQGSYAQAPCTTVVSLTQGSQNLLYGILLLFVEAGKAPKYFSFVITPSKLYGFFTDTTQQITLKPSVAIRGTNDTLIISKNNSLIINGVVVENLVSIPTTAWNAAGIYVYPGITATFNQFAAGINDGSPIVFNPKKKNSKETSFSKKEASGTIYNLRGQHLTSFTGMNTSLYKKLGVGPHLIIWSDGSRSIEYNPLLR